MEDHPATIAILNALVCDLESARNIVSDGDDHDSHLVVLQVIVGNLAFSVAGEDRKDLIQSIFKTALVIMAWLLTTKGQTTENVVESIIQERHRQRQLFRDGKFIVCCWHPNTDIRRKFRILAEEVGEVAHAIDQLELHPHAPAAYHSALVSELVQVAAVAVAWLESLEVKS